MQSVISQRASNLNVPIVSLRVSAFQVLATGLYLEPVSGTPQSTPRSRSSRTLPPGSGADTCPRSPTRGGRREESGSRSDIDHQPRRPVISPETEAPRHTLKIHSHTKVIFD